MVLRVLNCNLREGGRHRVAGISDLIRRQMLQVVALLESNSREGTAALAHELGMEQACGKANTRYHVAWLSQLPIRRKENHRLAVLSKTLLEIEVIWAGDPLRLFATHLASRHDVHSQAGEIPAVLDATRRAAGSPHLLMGDVNSLRLGDPIGVPPQRVEKRGDATKGASRRVIQLILESGYFDCYRLLHPNTPGYTYPSAAPWLRLDYIFASPEMGTRLRACDIVTGQEAERASDHFPIWADFQ